MVTAGLELCLVPPGFHLVAEGAEEQPKDPIMFSSVMATRPPLILAAVNYIRFMFRYMENLAVLGSSESVPVLLDSDMSLAGYVPSCLTFNYWHLLALF